MVADKDISLATDNFLAAVKLIPNEGKHAEDPTPKRQESITYPADAITKKERQKNTWQEEEHEYGEHD
jgi:hypothetical protein